MSKAALDLAALTRSSALRWGQGGTSGAMGREEAERRASGSWILSHGQVASVGVHGVLVAGVE